MMDFGYPQYTEARILSEFIKTDAYRMEVTQRPPMAVTNAVSWRSEGLQYKKNEVSAFVFKRGTFCYPSAVFFLVLQMITASLLLFLQVFLDVIENVNILVNSNGQIIRSDVVGALKMRTYLTYVPKSFEMSSPFCFDLCLAILSDSFSL